MLLIKLVSSAHTILEPVLDVLVNEHTITIEEKALLRVSPLCSSEKHWKSSFITSNLSTKSSMAALLPVRYVGSGIFVENDRPFIGLE